MSARKYAYVRIRDLWALVLGMFIGAIFFHIIGVSDSDAFASGVLWPPFTALMATFCLYRK